MEEPEKGILELRKLLKKLNDEADKVIKNVDDIRKKGLNAVNKAEGILTPSIRSEVKAQSKDAIFLLIERLVETNCDLELADDESPNLKITYLPVGNATIELKFLAGDSPWNFWLCDGNVDLKTLHINLLKKYQNNLLDPYPRPKPAESVCFVERNKVLRGIVLQAINENRVKLIDCDSNVSKVIDSERVFKADPDACHVHASALKCTITKDNAGAQLWNTELRDMFCSALKEAVLNVKVLERLPGSFPSFVVDVEMQSENSVGNLKEWILERLFPELKKLTTDSNESVYDFISAEALNPYTTPTFEKKQKVDLSESSSLRNPQDENTNNLNFSTNKVSIKIVPNVGHSEEEKSLTAEDNVSGIFVSSSEVPVSSSDCGTEVTSTTSQESQTEKISDHVKKTDVDPNNKVNHSSTEFRPMKPPGPAVVRPNVHRHHPHIPSGFYQLNMYHQPPFQAPYPGVYPAPYFPHQVRPSYPPTWNFEGQPALQMQSGFHGARNPLPPPALWSAHNPPSAPQVSEVKPWSTGEDPQESGGDNLKISNVNNISVNVNVMAPEFVPKMSTDSKKLVKEQRPTTDIGEVQHFDIPAVLPATEEIVHIELRKPRSLLTPGENLLVLMSHVESPSEFYINFVTKNNSLIDKLHEEMFSYYTSKEKVVYSSWKEAKKALGKFCACKWLEDNHWYRVEVLDWTLGNNVKVYFVDYGNTDSVPLNCLQPLNPLHSKLPMCAQACHLAMVHPLEKGKPWSKDAVEFFKSKVEVDNTRIYSITVVPSKKKQIKMNSLSVLLYEGKATDEDASINNLLVDYGLAWSRKLENMSQSSESEVYLSLEEVPQASGADIQDKKAALTKPHLKQLVKSSDLNKWDDWDPQAEDYNSPRNNPAIDTDDPGVALIGYSAKDETRICKFYARDGFCWKELCHKEHSNPNPDGITTDKEEVYCRAFSEMALPSVGEVIRVKVTAVLSISLFYVQLTESKSFAIDDDDGETLSILNEFMNRPENVQKMKYLQLAPALGQLVLARWEGWWYRARVVSADDEKPEVMFVDFGTMCTVSATALREMEPRYLHLPFQAIECSLANIIPPPAGSKMFKEGTEILKGAIECFVLTAKVYDSLTGETFQKMELVLEDEYGDIGDFLVSKGAATKANLNWSCALKPKPQQMYYPG